MDDQLFLERAHANPHDDSAEFLLAVAENPARQELLESLKVLDKRLESGLTAISAPEHLKKTLLNIPQGTLHPDTQAVSANDSFWRRNFQYAAGLVVAVGVIAMMLPGRANSLEEVVMRHLYSELSFLEDHTPVSMSYVNNVMSSNRKGMSFLQSPDMSNIEIDVSEDCWVDFQNGVKGVHIVMKGNVGQITVMVIPNEPIGGQIAISDDRFEGVITPTPGGNLVVIGEKEESIQQYSTMLAANITW